jgi:iron complex transport system ATP-binding protein
VLSQGERQRILIGRALMARPRLLILDEPCAGLDPVAREHFLAFLQRLGERRGAPALIFVTHHVEEIMPVFTHALLLRGGRLLASGKKRAVLTSARLSETFAASLRVAVRAERYTLASHSARVA